MTIKNEIYDPREPVDLEAENSALSEQAYEYRDFLVAAIQLLSGVKAAVRLPFRLEYEVDRWLQRAARR